MSRLQMAKGRVVISSFHPEMAFFAISALNCGVACAAYPFVFLELTKNSSFLTGLLPGMPAFLAGWKEAIKDSELPYREAKASIGNLR